MNNKIYILWATYHNLDDRESMIAIYANEKKAYERAKELQNDISVEIVELHVSEEEVRE